MKLPEELSQRIASHVESVRKGLASLSPDERQDILQSIETHIHDALQKQSGDTPTIEVLEAVIAGMDDPESYTEAATLRPKSNARRTAVVAASIIILAVFGSVLWINRPHTPQPNAALRPLSEETTAEQVKQAVITISRCAESDPRVSKALASLEGLNEELVVKQLTAFLGSDKNTVRRSAIFILWHGSFEDIGSAARPLLDLCSHSEQYTRGVAAIALGVNKIHSSFDVLCKMTTDDPDAYARRCAAYALGLLGDGKARPILKKALQDSNAQVQNNAKAALEMIPELIQKSQLPTGMLEMTESEALRTGVLHASNAKSGQSDIFLSDPVRREWRNLTKGRLNRPGWGQPWEPVGSPDGKTVVIRIYRWIDNTEMRTQVWLLDMDSDNLRQIPGEFGFVMGFTWSPDSKSFACYENHELMVFSRDNMEKKVIVTAKGKIHICAWSPKGDLIGYVSGANSFGIVAADGKSNRQIDCNGISEDSLIWRPTGERIAVVVNGLISIISLDGEIIKQYEPADELHGWSSDGKLLAYQTRVDGVRKLHIQSLEDGRLYSVNCGQDATSGLWMPVNNQLVFWGKNAGNRHYSLVVADSDGKNLRIFGKAHRGGFMAPSLLGSALLSRNSVKKSSSQASEDHKRPPLVVETIPRNGDKNVDPGISEIRVTFDKIMLTDRMWSWCYESPDSFPEMDTDRIRYIDDKTCVAPVKLKPATSYVIWFNTAKHTSFRDRYHNKAVPYRLEFRTSGQ
jgi:Tol biopolymer transport system component